MSIVDQLLQISPPERRAYILSQDPDLKALVGSKGLGQEVDLDVARRTAAVINSFIEDYFARQIEADRSAPAGSILESANLGSAIEAQIRIFSPIAIETIRKSLPTKETLALSSKNIYELAGAVKLSAANSVTRNLSTTMGMLWERIANLSPYAINPEAEFYIKIRGIDLIAKNRQTGVVEYQQLKTQKNTLTGGQQGRSVAELTLHEHPVFCACFDTKSTWTFSYQGIPRVAGRDFWSRIGVDYDVVLASVKPLILELEDAYVEMLEG